MAWVSSASLSIYHYVHCRVWADSESLSWFCLLALVFLGSIWGMRQDGKLADCMTGGKIPILAVRGKRVFDVFLTVV
ncbi:MAG: hypothetical protein D9C04_04780 [Nitrosopumilus sp. B06]|nr:MAG: hypothetical protein D9C04_04780 [Nitrosopumilus sp. B06]